MAQPPFTPPSWSSVIDNIKGPEQFLAWIAANSKQLNRLTKQFVAGTVINGGRAVYLHSDNKIYPFDINNEWCFDRFVGIAETSTNAGDVCVVVTYGVSHVVGSGWVAGVPYYVNSSGYLASSPPEIGLVLQVGIGIDGERILIEPHQRFELI